MSIYKTPEAKAKIMELYEQKLADCNLEDYKSHYVETSAGRTHIIITGEEHLPPLLVLHGINAGAPMSLEALQDLYGKYRIYAVDSIGQATRSEETRLSVKDNSYGQWLGEVMEQLGLARASVVGISYGGFLLLKLIMAHPEKVQKAIFVVPGGIVNSGAWLSVQKLFFPMTRFFITKKDKDLQRFISSFYTEIDDYALAFQRETLLGIKMDYQRPPLLSAQDVEGFEAPVYAIVVDDDVFFPGEACLKKLREAFRNFKESHTLTNCQHIPSACEFTEICQYLNHWLSAEPQPDNSPATTAANKDVSA